MDLPDESQWDETTCNLAVCQHPQCWAAIRRIERGHPRILGSPCKTPLDVSDKLPVLTIVNLSDSCFQAKRCPHRHLRRLNFTKRHSLLSQGSKFKPRFQGRPHKDLPDKDWINCTNRSSKVNHRLKKLPVLNLNETKLPCPQDVRNMVVIWIPKEPEEHVGPAEKCIVPRRDRKKKGKKTVVDIETQLRSPGIIMPPSSPVHVLEQRKSEFLPLWNQFDTLPPDLLNDLLSGEGKTMLCPEMKTQLAIKKKKPPLEKSRPDSAICAEMFLFVHRLTLQTPALKYPAHLKKSYCGLKTQGQRKQQQQQQQEQEQQRKLKTPTMKQEAKKKSKSDPRGQSTSHKRLGTMVCDPRYGHRTLPGEESDKNQQQQMKKKGSPLKQDSTERPQMDYAENYLDSFPSEQNLKLPKTESTNEDISTHMEVMAEAQETTPKDLSANTSRASWNSELKLLRSLQSIDYENEKNQLPGTQREESPKA